VRLLSLLPWTASYESAVWKISASSLRVSSIWARTRRPVLAPVLSTHALKMAPCSRRRLMRPAGCSAGALALRQGMQAVEHLAGHGVEARDHQRR